jgi:hypothetical protein
MIPLRQQVTIPNVYMAFDNDGALKDPTAPDRQAAAVLNEIAAWSHSISNMPIPTG